MARRIRLGFGAKPYVLAGAPGRYNYYGGPTLPKGQGAGTGTTLTHGQAFTLNGSGFGTRPNYNAGGFTWKGQAYLHYCWCDFTEVTPPVSNSFPDWKLAMNGIYPTMYQGSNFVAPRSVALDGSGIASGGPSFGGLYWQRGPNASGAISRFGGLTLRFYGFNGAYGTFPGTYCSAKYQCTPSLEATPGNQKTYRHSFNFPNVELIPQNWQSGYVLGAGNQQWGPPLHAQTSSSLFGSGSAPSPISNFVRLEMVTDSTGVFHQRVNNAQTLWSNSSFVPGATYPNPTYTVPQFPASNWGSWTDSSSWQLNDTTGNCLIVFCAESAIAAAYNQNIADIYFDFTAARVECTDGTYAEPQILLNWSNTQIKFLGNKGQMSSGPGTLNVYDATDTLLQSFSVTIQ